MHTFMCIFNQTARAVLCVMLATGLAACEMVVQSAGTLGGGAGAFSGLVVVPKRMTYFPDEVFLPQSDTEVYRQTSGGLSRPVMTKDARFMVAESDLNPVFHELKDDSDGRYFVFSTLGEARIRVEYDGMESVYTVRVLDPSGGTGPSGNSGGSGNIGGNTGGGIIIAGP